MSRTGTLALAGSFASAGATYWMRVWPATRAHLRRLNRRAQCAPDPRPRRLALHTLREKWTNVEGAAAFAVLAPSRPRSRVLKALICWQAAYDLADTLSENGHDKSTESLKLHQALHSALTDSTDPRRRSPVVERDGGYLRVLVEEARRAYTSLPSHRQTVAAAVDAAQRITCYQTLHHQRSHADLARWAGRQTPPGTELSWWETSAAAASSLAALAMIATAGDPLIPDDSITRIEWAYWPFASALHTLLDSLVDQREDARTGQPSLLDHATAQHAADRLGSLAKQSIQHALPLREGRKHVTLLTGMVGLYLSDPNADLPAVRAAKQSVIAAVGGMIRPAIAIVGLRRQAKAICHPRISRSPLPEDGT